MNQTATRCGQPCGNGLYENPLCRRPYTAEEYAVHERKSHYACRKEAKGAQKKMEGSGASRRRVKDGVSTRLTEYPCPVCPGWCIGGLRQDYWRGTDRG